jgi:hypothetical protein
VEQCSPIPTNSSSGSPGPVDARDRICNATSV